MLAKLASNPYDPTARLIESTNAAATVLAVTPDEGTTTVTVGIEMQHWASAGTPFGPGGGTASMMVRGMVPGPPETPVTLDVVTVDPPGGLFAGELGLTRRHGPHGPPAGSTGPNSITYPRRE